MDTQLGITFDSLKLGDARQCDLIVGEEQVRAFAALSGDVNPIHMDAAFAREAGFPKPVAHGMLALAAISRLIGTELPGPGALWMSQTVQFTRPVFVGDALTASVTVEHLSAGTGVVSLKTEVRNLRTGEVVLAGVAQVRIVERGATASDSTVADRASTLVTIGQSAFGQSTSGQSAVGQSTTAAVRSPRVARSIDIYIDPTTRVALVTGSSRGVGHAIATALAADGAAVVVHYLEREEPAQELVDAIMASGGRAAACRADLSQPDGADRLHEAALAVFGRIDILVNNATPPIVLRPVLDCTWADFQSYLDVYLRATVALVQRSAPGMQERRFGRIINVLSSYAFGAPPVKLAPYVAAKSALAGLSRSLAVELGPFGITVNMIAPSVLMTEQTGAMSERARQLAASQVPMRRLASLEDVATAAKFLASDEAEFITGTVMPVTGGGVMW